MKKRVVIATASVLLILCMLVFVPFFVLRIYSERNIDKESDVNMFRQARLLDNTVYYAFTRSGEVREVWRDTADGVRSWYALGELGELLPRGFIAMEDAEFYSHSGVNLRRTAAAAFNYLFHIKEEFGASTITQQVIKNISGDSSRTAKRKLNEIVRASALEKRFSKDEILEMYLNIIPMAGNIYGVGMASRIYFGKEPSMLTAAEAATLIGITNAPGRYDPYKHPDACREKRDRVLYAMHRDGVIDDANYSAALEEELCLTENINEDELIDNINGGVCSWFVEGAKTQIVEDIMRQYNISRIGALMMLRGAHVYLSMNIEMQDVLEAVFADANMLPNEVAEGLNFAMTVIDNESGMLVATVGGCGKKNANRLLDRARAPITPGSTLKPLAIYAPLLESGEINWSTVIDDTPVETIERDGVVIPYPQNASRRYDGLTTVFDAIRQSKNTVAVKLYERLGADRICKELDYRFGISTVTRESRSDGSILTDHAPSPLALGQLTRGTSIFELTRAYAAFPRDGLKASGGYYYSVKASDGKTLLSADIPTEMAVSSTTARLMNQFLSGVVDSGTARTLSIKDLVDTAGKTGTSGRDRDRCFVGYTPYYTAGIWCGYDGLTDNGTIGSISPSHLSIWDNIMRQIHALYAFDGGDEALKSFSTEGLVYLPYCTDSGALMSESCAADVRGSRLRYGYFARDNMPLYECDMHIMVDYDGHRGCIADEYTDEGDIIRASLVRSKCERPWGIEIGDSAYVLDNYSVIIPDVSHVDGNNFNEDEKCRDGPDKESETGSEIELNEKFNDDSPRENKRKKARLTFPLRSDRIIL